LLKNRGEKKGRSRKGEFQFETAREYGFPKRHV
jgi:hypothetical protein